MEFSLNESIVKIFEGTNNHDLAEFMKAFSKDARVIDDGQEHNGLDEIVNWAKQNIFDSNIQMNVVKVIENDDLVVVTADVDGDFDKTGLPNPLYFDYYFTVQNNKVIKLEIVFVDQDR